jgi:hypothetical protein
VESIRGTGEIKLALRPDKVLNPAVKVIKEAADGYAYQTLNGLIVIQSLSVEGDGNMWLHTSFSRKSRMPSYDDMAMVKRLFIGDDKKAIMVFPEKKHYVNIHKYCLHFFTPVYHDPLPEFSRDGTI